MEGQAQDPQGQQPQGQQGAQGQDPQGTQDPGNSQGRTPDWQRAASDYKAQRDAAREQVAQLTGQMGELRKSIEGLKTAEDVQKAVDEALASANAEFEAYKSKASEREKALTVGSVLAKAGCIDVDALLSHVDMSGVKLSEDGTPEGVDPKALRESYPYLFGAYRQAGSTDASPRGAASGGIGERIDAAMGVKE